MVQIEKYETEIVPFYAAFQLISEAFVDDQWISKWNRILYDLLVFGFIFTSISRLVNWLVPSK